MRRSRSVLAAPFFVLVACLPLWAGTIVVDAAGGGDYTDIQSAIDEAEDGDTVLVKPGEYVIDEPINFNRLHDPADPQSPPVKDIAVRSEAGPEETIIRMSDQPADPNRTSIAIFGNGESEDSILEGFTLTGGRGTLAQERAGGTWWMAGGGVFCYDKCSPTLVQCVITDNTAQLGAVACAYDASPTLIECTIAGNLSTTYGGGLFLWYTGPVALIRCAIVENVCVGSYGGGIDAYFSSPTLTDCWIYRNVVYGDPGGGGINCGGGSPTLTGCVIQGNQAGSSGGGVCAVEGATPSLTNCLIFGNVAGQSGGGYSGTGTLVNCTITGNSAGAAGGVASGGGLALLRNSIVWGNTPETVQATLDHCVAEQDPRFTSNGAFDFARFTTIQIMGIDQQIPDFIIDAGDYHLQSGSPALDAGLSAGAPSIDIDGTSRPQGQGIDIGAYECTPYRFSLSPESGPIPLEIRVEGTPSPPPPETIASYRWNFGDGATAEGREARHRYEKPGRYAIALTVTGEKGWTRWIWQPVTALWPSGDVSPWKAVDIGTPFFPGGASLAKEGEKQWFEVYAGGAGIAGRSDEGHFIHQELRGDFVLIAAIESFVSSLDGSVAGLMIRESLDPGARYVEIGVGYEPELSYRLRYRTLAGSRPGSRKGNAARVPAWLRLERKDRQLIGSASVDGATWTEVGRRTFSDLAQTILAGFFAAGNDTGHDMRRFEPLQVHVWPLRVEGAAGPAFRRGDTNADGSLDLGDAIFLLNYLFASGQAPPCVKAGDTDDGAVLDLGDAISLLNYLFATGAAPAAPFPACGRDPTADGLACDAFPPCN